MKTILLLGVLCIMATVNVFSDDANIFSYTVGNIEVSTMVENRGQRQSSVLANPDPANVQKYLPSGTYQAETNTFLVKTPSQIILVDTGFGTTLFDNLASLGVSADQINAVLITHMHGDHINGLQKDGKALFPNAKVFLSVQEKEFSANQAAALAPYENNVQTFVPGELGTQIEDLLPGIKAIAAFGHTPGHTIFMVSSEGKQLLICGDLVHVEDIQFAVPEQSVTYDTDPNAAADIRKKVLDYVSKNDIPIAGMHMRYPAIRKIADGGAGSYSFKD